MEIHILWAVAIAFSAVMYTIFDGFDLGVGILLPFIKNEKPRDTIVDSITPVWDGNETWIVLMGVELFGGFPKAYSILLPALYTPLIIMIIAMALRGVSMEFRFVSTKNKVWWDAGFAGGSIMAAFCQGIVLGNLMEGIETPVGLHGIYHSMDLLTPFTILIGIALVIAYALIGANWLNLKTTGNLQQKFKKFSAALIVIVTVIFVVIIYGRFHLSVFSPRFGIFGLQSISSPVSICWYIIAGLLLLAIGWSLKRKTDWLPFGLNILLSCISAAYLVSGFWPYIVPPSLSIFEASAPAYGTTILLYASFVIIPIILGYLVYSYIIFRKKVTGKEHYDPTRDRESVKIKQVTPTISSVVKEPVIQLSWPVRLLIAIAGIIFFFTALGLFGDFLVFLSIGLFVTIFFVGWAKSGKHIRADDNSN